MSENRPKKVVISLTENEFNLVRQGSQKETRTITSFVRASAMFRAEELLR